jgi:hypothetical protein
MRRSTPGFAWLFLVGLSVTLAGCDKAGEAGGSGASGAAANDDGPNPPAVTVQQAVAAIDLRQFPVMKGAMYVERTPSHASFTVPNGVVKTAADFARAKLAELGWKPAADPKLTQVVGEGAQLFFEKDGQRLYSAIGVSPADKNLNFTLFHLGNIDARKLPHYQGVEFADSLPSRTIASAGTVKPDDVQKALRKPFVDAGWQEYAEPVPKGMPKFEREDRYLKFLQNGVGVDITIMPFQGKTNIYTTVRLQDEQWPIDAAATNIEFEDDPIYLFYITKTDLKPMIELTRGGIIANGWKPVEGKGKSEPHVLVAQFTKPEQDPLRLEVLRDKEITLVMIRRWSNEDDKKDAKAKEDAANQAETNDAEKK